MKIKLNKDHLNHKAGDEIEVTEAQAEYFRRVGMVAIDESKSSILHAAAIVDTPKHGKRGPKPKNI